MAVRTRLGSLLRKKCDKRVPLQELLAQTDAYDWDSVDDIPVNVEERRKIRERLRYLNEVIYASGIELNGSILDLACGVASLAYLYPDVVAVDYDPRKIKMLRKDGIKGVVADIERLPFERKSFDYVVSISPPHKPIRILHRDGYVRFDLDQDYNRRIVDAALRIARKKVLIASRPIAFEPPHEHMIKKRSTDGYHYVIYGVNSGNKILGP